MSFKFRDVAYLYLGVGVRVYPSEFHPRPQYGTLKDMYKNSVQIQVEDRTIIARWEDIKPIMRKVTDASKHERSIWESISTDPPLESLTPDMATKLRGDKLWFLVKRGFDIVGLLECGEAISPMIDARASNVCWEVRKTLLDCLKRYN